MAFEVPNYQPPIITTSGTTYITMPQQQLGVATPPALPEPELGPLDWLRTEVAEVCELARSA